MPSNAAGERTTERKINMKYENPYLSTLSREQHRTTIIKPKRLMARLQSVHPQAGVLQTTINILLFKLENELTRLNLTTYDSATFEYAVANATLVLAGNIHTTGGSSFTEPTTGLQHPIADETTSRNDDGRTTNMARKNTRP